MSSIQLVIVTTAVCMASAVSGAPAPPFMCGSTSVCNLERGVTQYCTSGPEGRCKSCADEVSRCFTERMAYNCTSYCRELDKEATLKAAREKPCSRLGNLMNGNHNATDSPRPGDFVQSTCDPEHRLVGSDVIRCLEFGVWSGDLPSCTHTVCTSPIIPNGDVQGTILTTAVGGYLGYRCDDGYSPADPHSRALCLPDGTWRGATCSQVVLVPSKNDEWVLVLAIGSSVALGIIIIAIGIWTGLKRRSNNDRLKNDDEEAHQNKNGDIPANAKDNADSECPSDMTPLGQYIDTYDSPTTDEKKAEAKPLLSKGDNSRSPPTAPPLDQQYSKSHSSHHSMTSFTDSTARKEVPESDHLPSGDGQSKPENNPSRSSSLGSDGNDTDKVSFTIGEGENSTASFGNSSGCNGSLAVQVNINCNSPQYTNSSSNCSNNFNCSNNNGSVKNLIKQTNGCLPNKQYLEKADNAAEEEDASLDHAHFSTQEEAPDNSKTRATDENVVRHAHPTDDGKPGKLMLPGNIVSLGDVERKSKTSR